MERVQSMVRMRSLMSGDGQCRVVAFSLFCFFFFFFFWGGGGGGEVLEGFLLMFVFLENL